jgi:hypothetical protein
MDGLAGTQGTDLVGKGPEFQQDQKMTVVRPETPTKKSAQS